MNRFQISHFSPEDIFQPTQPFQMSEYSSQNPEEAEAAFQKGYEKQTQGDLFGAIELYKKSIELYETAEAYTYLAWAYSAQGHFEDAILECQKAIGLDPDFGNPYNDIGAYLIEMGKGEEAVPWLEKAIEAKRYDARFYPYYNLGRVWEKKGDWFKAFESYSKALDHKPDYTLAKKAIGRLQSLMN